MFLCELTYRSGGCILSFFQRAQEEGGQLTEAVRRNPHSLILLDELEKAHPDVLNILLQIMEDGMLTDGKGRTVNFKNTILVMTSNVGSRRILEMSRLNPKPTNGDDFSQEDSDALYGVLSEVVKEELELEMRPELLNRIDEIVVFSPLAKDDLSMIADLILKQTVNRAQKEQEMNLSVAPALTQRVMEEGSSNAAQFGARPMRRAAQRFFEDAISDAIVRGFLVTGDSAVVDLAAEENIESRYYNVQITRSSDGTSFQVPVEKASGGIGLSYNAAATAAPPKKKRPNGAENSFTLETEPSA
jgi:ATP-dependent Clp protease ATP-binding subunit ClpC